MSLSRRDLLKVAGLAGAGAAAFGLPAGRQTQAGTPSLLSSRNFPKPYAAAFVRQLVQRPDDEGVDGDGPYARYSTYAKEWSAKILPTLSTPLLGYTRRGEVGSRIDVEKGTRIEMTVHHKGPELHPSFGTPLRLSTHLHGSASLPQYDGYASDITLPGQMKTYRYPNFQNARTLWYHDHAVHTTAQNVYAGLAAQYHLHDAQERALLPTGGEFDVALSMSDMMFKANGSQLYDDRSFSGLWGDVILVNGQPWPVMKVKRRVYRFRLLNASISRSYRPTLSPALPMHMVATDGGLMPKTQAVTSYRHAPAERYEFLIDFSKVAAGTRVLMKNLSNKNNRDYDHTGKIMAFDVTDEPFDTDGPSATTIPVTLDPGNPVMKLAPTSTMRKRTIAVKRSDVTNLWNLNGESWDDVIASGYTKVLANPGLGDTEIWDVTNSSGGWFHPVHIHLVDFKIVSRNGKPPFAYEQGPKDVVYVGEGETVRLIMKFGPHKGKYMVHCHNLPHEDHDMMHQFSVGLKPGEVDTNDPIETDRPTDCSDDDDSDD